jgi:hypothetical protein
MRSAFTGNVQLVAGSAETIPPVLALLEREGISTRGNPDVYVRAYRHFGIDEARELSERAALRPVSGTRRVFVVATPGMTNEAQNALLKTLEEPAGDSLFFFILPSPTSLLPTVRSRAQIFSDMAASDAGITSESIDAKDFLAAPVRKRLDMLKPLLEKDEDDKRDQAAVISFLSSVERSLSERVVDAGVAEGLEAVYRARHYLGDKGALVKPLLEQVALLVPKM